MRHRRAILAPSANTDLRNLRLYIAENTDADTATVFVTKLADFIRDVASKGLTGTARPDFGKDVRSFVHGRFHVLVTVTDHTVNVIGIKGAAQDIAAYLNDSSYDAEADHDHDEGR